jgi:SAM-dependent methyltransferase
MKLHITLARALIRLGAFLQSSAVMVMSSDDLVEFSRHQYAKPTTINDWNRDDLVAEGLYSDEQQLLEHIPIRTGQLLLLNVGGGREAVPFARIGFDVTGVDFIPEMVERAIMNAERSNVKIKGLVQEISVLDVPAETYDIAWLSAAMYSCIPTRARRVQMLQRVRGALKPGGYFALQFQWDSTPAFSRKGDRIRQIIAWLTLGNRSYERGDILWGNVEFIHAFSSESDLLSEFAAGGFSMAWMNIPTDGQIRGEALLQKLES